MTGPADIGPGAVLRDPGCHSCPHAHHILPCDFDIDGALCPCASDFAPGVDTALGG